MNDDELPNGFSHELARQEAANLFRLLNRGETVQGLRELIKADGTDTVANFRRRVLEYFDEFVTAGRVYRRSREQQEQIPG
jgi:hypothetical protein